MAPSNGVVCTGEKPMSFEGKNHDKDLFSGIFPHQVTQLEETAVFTLTCPPKTGPGKMLDLDRFERGFLMSKKRYGSEQIITKVREVEIMLSKGARIGEASKRIGVTEQTFYRWRKQYGGMKVEQAKRLKDLEKENFRLKKLVADLSLDNAILKEVSRGNF